MFDGYFFWQREVGSSESFLYFPSYWLPGGHRRPVDMASWDFRQGVFTNRKQGVMRPIQEWTKTALAHLTELQDVEKYAGVLQKERDNFPEVVKSSYPSMTQFDVTFNSTLLGNFCLEHACFDKSDLGSSELCIRYVWVNRNKLG